MSEDLLPTTATDEQVSSGGQVAPAVRTDSDSSDDAEGPVASPGAPEHGAKPPSRGESGLVGDEAEVAKEVPLDAVVAMEAALTRFHTRAEEYESVIRQMQRRIEDLQSDQIRELLKPVIVKLADMHTEASAAEERASAREDDSARKDFDLFVEEIESTLGLLDIESIGAAALDEFQPARHAARRRIDTDDPSLDRRVAKVIRQGFTYIGAERVFVPAIVSVYRYQSTTDGSSVEDVSTTQESN